MPTPWPKPAPRIVSREAACAEGARAHSSARDRRADRVFIAREAGRTLGRQPTEVGVAKVPLMSSNERNAADLFVECLEAEGVEYVFGIPGEETLDLNRALEESTIRFIPVRHEQGG